MLLTTDADLARYLHLFTLLPTTTITALMQTHARKPSARTAHHRLAAEFVALVHGREAAEQAASQHARMFGRRTTEGSASVPSTAGLEVDALVPTAKLAREEVVAVPLVRVLCDAGIVASRSEGRRLLLAGGCYLGYVEDGSLKYRKVVGGEAEETVVGEQDLVDGRMLVVRKGKGKVRVVEVVE